MCYNKHIKEMLYIDIVRVKYIYFLHYVYLNIHVRFSAQFELPGSSHYLQINYAQHNLKIASKFTVPEAEDPSCIAYAVGCAYCTHAAIVKIAWNENVRTRVLSLG